MSVQIQSQTERTYFLSIFTKCVLSLKCIMNCTAYSKGDTSSQDENASEIFSTIVENLKTMSSAIGCGRNEGCVLSICTYAYSIEKRSNGFLGRRW